MSAKTMLGFRITTATAGLIFTAGLLAATAGCDSAGPPGASPPAANAPGARAPQASSPGAGPAEAGASGGPAHSAATPASAASQAGATEPAPAADAAPAASTTETASTTEDKHVHTAPHGGLLIELGDHFANLELVFARETGELTLYLLDAHAENAIRSQQGRLMLTIDAIVTGGQRETPTDLVITIPGEDNVLTGETADNTSEFRLIAKPLRGVDSFEARVQQLFVKSQEFKDVPVRWPGEPAGE